MNGQDWQLHHVRVFAYDDQQKAKAAQLVQQFVDLAKANGLTVEHATYPVSGHRRGASHGREQTDGPGGR